ncbi:hypothetical protein ACFWDQ_36345 [Streptomyces sp. NPDC060053]|uniref:hypothetical protein n=1 Tax=Streptomyces sp. NPDC060053 TaxID=3347047 RepID=UPI0036C9109C
MTVATTAVLDHADYLAAVQQAADAAARYDTDGQSPLDDATYYVSPGARAA